MVGGLVDGPAACVGKPCGEEGTLLEMLIEVQLPIEGPEPQGLLS